MSKTITVYSELLPDKQRTPYQSDDSRLEQRRSPSSTLSVDKIRESITEFSNTISEILSSLPENENGFSVDQIEAHAVVDFEGGIQLLGAKLGASVEGGLKFVWRRSKK